jgi:hypothetical protein
MAESAAQTFTGITPARFAQLAAKAQGAGINISGASGAATKFGVTVSWNYVPQTEVLTIQTLATPIFVSPADVDARIRALVTSTAG